MSNETRIIFPDSMAILWDAKGELTPVAKQFAELVARSAVRKAVSELEPFLKHKDYCAFWGYRACTCELSPLRKKYGVEG